MMATPSNSQQELLAQQKLIIDQREANEQMVRLTIRSLELMEQAQEAQEWAAATAAELRDREERYRALFNLSPVAVYSCDASGVIQQCNRHAAELWGREPAPGDTDERFCGSFKLFRPDGTFMPHELCPMAEVVSGKIAEVSNAEVVIERPDGSRVTVLVNIRPVKDHSGRVTSVINCFYDITERKKAESRVTDALNREREVAEFRERFIGILGHDLRNPLNAVLVASKLLLAGGALTEDDARLTNRIVNSGQRMVRMISQLLDFTRARLGGGFELNLTASNLGEICRETAEELRLGSPVEIRQTSEGDLGGTWDADRLAQAVSNIAGNAVQHAKPGTPIVIHSHEDSGTVVVEITNQGETIPADLLPTIFKAFRQAGAKGADGGNLGLGLYIASEIVRAHGGALDVRSSDGTTTFTLRLPRVTSRSV